MSDQDFNFSPPPPRREAKKVFEPPPWEKEQFDELARRKEAERIAAEALAAAATQQQVPAQPVQPAASPASPPPETQAVAPQQVSAAPVAQPPTAERAPGAEEGEAVTEDPRIEAMMLGLRNEEPSFGEDVWKISVGAGAVLAAIGAVFVVWGIVALAATRGAGIAAPFGGVVLTAFGLVFAGIGVWMVLRTMRQRGVL